MLVGILGNCPSCPCAKTALFIGQILKKGVEIQLNPSNLGSKQSFDIELQLPILIMPFHLIFFKKLQSERIIFCFYACSKCSE
jgi:hypothetical protein